MKLVLPLVRDREVLEVKNKIAPSANVNWESQLADRPQYSRPIFRTVFRSSRYLISLVRLTRRLRRNTTSSYERARTRRAASASHSKGSAWCEACEDRKNEFSLPTTARRCAWPQRLWTGASARTLSYEVRRRIETRETRTTIDAHDDSSRIFCFYKKTKINRKKN